MSNQTLKRATDFLLDHQDEDGYWRDYCVGPAQSRSDAWITACVGYVLARTTSYGAEIEKAASALRAIRRPNGWGYNIHAACDADTTAWVIRFLASVDGLDGINVAGLLSRFITVNGRVKTFETEERHGRWASEHDEVAPLVGIALHASGEQDLAQRVRENTIRAANWQSFWWHCYSYGCAQNLEFLMLGGGVTDEVHRRETTRLAQLGSPSSAFDHANRVIALHNLRANPNLNELIAMQCEDGGWLPSSELLVPHQRHQINGTPRSDDRRLMTTAMVTLAIATALKTRRPQIAFNTM
jgi:hypothetical protein